MKIQTIETPRLFLRGFCKQDADFAIGIWNDPQMGEYLVDGTQECVDEEYRKMVETLGEDEQYCYLIAENKETGERIGTCSFTEQEKVYDIAYCVHKDFWRNGYATEMVGGMIDYARQQGALAVTAWITEGNAASLGLAAKFGFHKAAQSSYQKPGTDKTYVDYQYKLEL